MKSTEAPSLFLRRDGPAALVELVIGHGGGACTVYVLRPTQLRQLAQDAMQFTLGTTISVSEKPMNGKRADG